MASTLQVVFGALVAAAVWTCLGLAITRRIAPAPLAGMLAPLAGWAVSSALALPILTLVGFSTTSVRLLTAAALVGSLLAIWRRASAPDGQLKRAEENGALLPWIWLGAAVLAIGPALAVLPKFSGDSVLLAPAIFDHSKIAIVDEMARLGLPPGNPFFGEAGDAAHLAYYYLFHFSAAVLALLIGISGWEADAAMTWFAGFASLLLMMGLAASIAGRAVAAFWILPLAAAASLRTFLALLIPSQSLHHVVVSAGGFGAWLNHASWAPQHLISGSCGLLTVWLMSRLVHRASPFLVVTIGFVAAAGFESSTWVGGVTFLVAALTVTVALLAAAEPRERLHFAVHLALAGLLAACLTAPFVLDQALAAAARNAGPPIALQPIAVLGDLVPEAWRRLLDLPAYWLVLLPVEYPAIYPVGVLAIAILLVSRRLEPEQQGMMLALATLAAASLAVSWLLSSRIGYNDLGWRAAIPGMMVLTITSAVGLTRWIAERSFVPVAAALLLVMLGLYEGAAQLRENALGVPSSQDRLFARAPELWAAVRRHSALWERVANNPLAFSRMTPWPGNIAWALLGDRRSCFAGEQLALAFAPLSRERRAEVDQQFIRVFSGTGTPDDVRALSGRFDCALAVVTAEDGAWVNDPFAESPFHELVESKDGEWRIYRRGPRQLR